MNRTKITFQNLSYNIWRFIAIWSLIIGAILTILILFDFLTGNVKFPWFAFLICLVAMIIGGVVLWLKPFKPN